MPPMNVTYVGNPKFACPRSYYHSVAVGSIAGGTIVLVGDVVQCRVPFGATFLTTYLTFDHRFIPWSSNRYTTDFPLLDQVSYLDGNPSPFYIAANVISAAIPGTAHFGYVFVFPGYAQLYEIALPPQPAGYWLPAPPP